SHGRQGVCGQAAQSAPGKGEGPWRIRLQSSQGTGSWEAGPWSQDRRQEEVGPRGSVSHADSAGEGQARALGRRLSHCKFPGRTSSSFGVVAPCPAWGVGSPRWACAPTQGQTSHSRAKAEAALTAAQKAQEEARIARITAKEFSPSFQHRENGLEYQRPKHQLSSDDIEVTSTGTPPQQESPELYRKGTTPSDLTPDDSPLQSFPASPTATPPPAPAARNKVAHFSRQVSVDEERGGDIQMLLEGRGGDYARNSWAEEKAGGSRGIRSGALRSSQPADDFRTRGAGHKQSGNPKPRERRTESPTTFSWTSHHRAGNPGPGGPRLLELDEEKLSNYEMEMKPLLRMDSYAQDVHPPKRRYSKGGAGRGPGEDHRADDRAFGAQRLRSKSQNKEHARPAPCTEPAVQRLESLRLGDRAEPRLLRWDLTFSPPQRSSPVALESDDENGDELKAST
ncbi:hypothetical protein FD754_017690, partial [Muntiacus muntjak]